MKKFENIIISVFAFLLPFTIFSPIGRPFVAGVLPIYVTPGVYAGDVAVLLVCLTSLFSSGGSSFSLLGFLKNAAHRNRLILGGILTAIPLIAAVGIPTALSPGLAAWFVFRWFLCVMLYWALAFGKFALPVFSRAFLVGLILQALVGLGQTISGHPLGLPGELALDPSQPRAAVLYTSSGQWLRAYGLTFHPNVLGGFLFSGLMLGVGLMKQSGWRWVGLVLGCGLVVTFSRSAWLATLVVFLPLVVWRLKNFSFPKKGFSLLSAAVFLIVLVTAPFVVPPLLSRLNVTDSISEMASIGARGELLNLSVDLIRSRPFTGVGAGNFPIAQMDFATQDPPHYVHNVGLLLAAEVGILGGGLWILLWLLPILWIPLQRVKSDWIYPLAAIWFGIGVIALWDSYPWAIESGRLLSVTVLAFLSKELDSLNL